MKFLKVWWTCIAAIAVLVVLSVVLVRGMGLEEQAWQEIFSAFYTLLGVSLIPTVFAAYQSFRESERRRLKWENGALKELKRVESFNYYKEK